MRGGPGVNAVKLTGTACGALQDPDAKKPEDWADDANIPDPTSRKPEDWVEEATIADPEAAQPEDWNAEEDGEWEAPQIPNPAYQGEWRQKTMPNPHYKGVWEVRAGLESWCMQATPCVVAVHAT